MKEKANEFFNKVIAMDAHHSEAHYHLGVLLEEEYKKMNSDDAEKRKKILHHYSKATLSNSFFKGRKAGLKWNEWNKNELLI